MKHEEFFVILRLFYCVFVVIQSVIVHQTIDTQLGLITFI